MRRRHPLTYLKHFVTQNFAFRAFSSPPHLALFPIGSYLTYFFISYLVSLLSRLTCFMLLALTYSPCPRHRYLAPGALALYLTIYLRPPLLFFVIWRRSLVIGKEGSGDRVFH